MVNSIADSVADSIVNTVARRGLGSFKDLKIWQSSVSLAVGVYKAVSKFPTSERFGLSSQITRSANSIGANIAESCGRFHYKDKVNFLYHARGSLVETEHHLIIAEKLGYITNDQLTSFTGNITDLGIKLNNYIKTLSHD